MMGVHRAAHQTIERYFHIHIFNVAALLSFLMRKNKVFPLSIQQARRHLNRKPRRKRLTLVPGRNSAFHFGLGVWALGCVNLRKVQHQGAATISMSCRKLPAVSRRLGRALIGKAENSPFVLWTESLNWIYDLLDLRGHWSVVLARRWLVHEGDLGWGEHGDISSILHKILINNIKHSFSLISFNKIFTLN